MGEVPLYGLPGYLGQRHDELLTGGVFDRISNLSNVANRVLSGAQASALLSFTQVDTYSQTQN